MGGGDGVGEVGRGWVERLGKEVGGVCLHGGGAAAACTRGETLRPKQIRWAGDDAGLGSSIAQDRV